MFRTLLAAAVITLAAAGAASAQSRVSIADLDLSTAAGAATLDARIERAAQALCRDARIPGSNRSDRVGCQAEVREDILRQLPAQARATYENARRSRIEA